MHVQFGPNHDVSHDLATSGAYEWWYVDAIDESRTWSFVVILFRGMPMSPDYLAALGRGNAFPGDHCGYAVTVYHHGRRIAMGFGGVPMADCSFATDKPDVTVGHCTLRQDDNGSFQLSVDVPGNGATQRVQLAATLHRQEGAAPFGQAPFAQDPHGWVLAAPHCACQATLAITDGGRSCVTTAFTGHAYHDHNYGIRPMQHDFRAWHWGRWHVGERAFVYLVAPDATTPFAWAGWCDADGTVEALAEPTLTVERWATSAMGVRHPHTLAVSGRSGDGTIVTAQVRQRTVLDDAPFYRRFLGDATIHGSHHIGISEYMAVGRLSSAWIRPFLRLPWQQ